MAVTRLRVKTTVTQFIVYFLHASSSFSVGQQDKANQSLRFPLRYTLKDSQTIRVDLLQSF